MATEMQAIRKLYTAPPAALHGSFPYATEGRCKTAFVQLLDCVNGVQPQSALVTTTSPAVSAPYGLAF